MRFDPPDGYRAAVDAIERALGVRYPSSAAASFEALGQLMETPRFRNACPDSRLLISPTDVSAARELMPADLLPFMHEPPDFYAFDTDSIGARRVVAWADHAIVADWTSCDQLIDWLTEFVEKGTLYRDWAAHNQPLQRTGPAGIFSLIRKLLRRGRGQ